MLVGAVLVLSRFYPNSDIPMFAAVVIATVSSLPNLQERQLIVHARMGSDGCPCNPTLAQDKKNMTEIEPLK